MRNRELNVIVFKGGVVQRNDRVRPNLVLLDIIDDLDTLYQLIGCDTIDIVLRKIGGKPYQIILDDEGLFANKPVLTMADPENKDDIIVGTVVIAGKADENGDLTSVTEEDVQHIENYIYYGVTCDKDERSNIIDEFFSVIMMNTEPIK